MKCILHIATKDFSGRKLKDDTNISVESAEKVEEIIKEMKPLLEVFFSEVEITYTLIEEKVSHEDQKEIEISSIAVIKLAIKRLLTKLERATTLADVVKYIDEMDDEIESIVTRYYSQELGEKINRFISKTFSESKRE